jgi:hypothetical protein
MTKQVIIAVVVGIGILFGAGFAFLNANKNQTTNTKTAVNTTNSENNIKGTIKDMLTSGKTSKCTFNLTNDAGNTSGTLYTSGNNARGDFITTSGGKNTNMYLIRNGETFYMWGDGFTNGIKMNMSVDQLASVVESDPSYSNLDPDENVDYKCDNWKEDKSLFTPPTSVKFSSFGNFAPNGTNRTSISPSANSNTDQCSICSSLTGQAKAMCLQQFNCQ